MAKIEITYTISHRSLMNKSKSDLADMVLLYADLNADLHQEIERLRGEVAWLQKDREHYRGLSREAERLTGTLPGMEAE